MARIHQRLTALSAARKNESGYYADGDGLYLQVASQGARSWIYRYMLAGRRREMGLGACSDISLAQARAKVTAARLMVKAGHDPIDARDAEGAGSDLERQNRDCEQGVRLRLPADLFDCGCSYHRRARREADHHGARGRPRGRAQRSGADLLLARSAKRWLPLWPSPPFFQDGTETRNLIGDIAEGHLQLRICSRRTCTYASSSGKGRHRSPWRGLRAERSPPPFDPPETKQF
jgi:hypothetical protein